VREPAWGVLIAVYLFFGGLSGGAMMLSAAAHLFGRSRDHAAIARAGALAAPFPVLLGTSLLVFDLGRPLFFWKLFVALQPFSPMWIGSWLLVLFSAVTLGYAYLHLPLRWQRWPVAHAEVWRKWLAGVGLPLGFSVAVYTAVLLGMLVARPLWNTPLVAILFVLSALSSAAALLIVIAPRGDDHLLSRLDVVLIVAEVLVLAALVFYGLVSLTSARDAVEILAADFAWSFWGGVVMLGLLAPLALDVVLLWRRSAERIALAAAWLVLIGGFLLRYVIVYAGQASRLS
jgi:formate-dependent nitrite reductase membrane component NrfD